MEFPKGATKKDKIFLKKVWIETLTGNLKDYERSVKDFEAQIQQSKRILSDLKVSIRKTKANIKDAENTKVD